MKNLIFLLPALLLSGCEKDPASPALNEFEVVVAGQGMDCRLPLIDFKEPDLTRLEKITGSAGGNRYHAYDLNESFDDPGQTIIISVRKTKNSEFSPCTTFGPAYPWVTVVDAKAAE